MKAIGPLTKELPLSRGVINGGCCLKASNLPHLVNCFEKGELQTVFCADRRSYYVTAVCVCVCTPCDPTT